MSFKIKNKNNIELEVIRFGASIRSLKIPINDIEKVDIVLGFEDEKNYVDSFNLESPPYFGCVVGRFSGRIQNSKFKLNDQIINLENNHGNHHLHGGKKGFSQVNWKLKSKTEKSIVLEHLSLDGEDNYPGEVYTTVEYLLTDDDEFIITMEAFTNKDTILNLTHHGYFNLDGHNSDVRNLSLEIVSNKILELDYENIPTGNFVDLKNHQYNFSKLKKCAIAIDNTFVINQSENKKASLYSHKNNLMMEVYTNQPAIHVYIGGNCFDKITGKNCAKYHNFSGICFETQNYPDAPNHINFPSSILRKGEKYFNKTKFKFNTLGNEK
jgi:aldose 1-epimerase